MYISKNKKSGIWYIYYRKENGKKTRISSHSRIKSDAYKFLNDFQRKTSLLRDQKLITVKDFSFRYLQNISIRHTKESYRTTKYIVDKFLESIDSEMYFSKLDKALVESYVLNKFHNAPFHAHLMVRHLKAFFNKAIELGYLDKNPLKNLKLRVPVCHPAFIGLNELNKILEVENDKMFYDIYIVTFYTGLRNSEIVNLQWDDCDLKRRIIKIQNKENFLTKNKRERIIPMNDKVIDILQSIEYQNSYGSNYVFKKDGRQINKMYLTKRFKKSVRQAGLSEKIHFHSLRHSFASNLVQKNVNLFTVQKLLGHTQISTTQRYSHLRSDDLVNAINTLD